MILKEDKIIANENEVLTLIKNYRDTKKNLLLTYLNQHCFNIYTNSVEYRRIIDTKFTVYLDGIGVYYALKFLGTKDVQKFNASDLNEKIFSYFISSNKKIFLIGGSFDSNSINILEEKGLNICGYQSGFFNSESESRIIDDIKNTEPDIVIIGMGIPKQEIFASKLIEKLSGKKIICVGNFLEFYLGTVKRVPKFLRNSGLEWLFRLITEPARLWQRYMLGIPLFIFSIIKIKLNLFKN